MRFTIKDNKKSFSYTHAILENELEKNLVDNFDKTKDCYFIFS